MGIAVTTADGLDMFIPFTPTSFLHEGMRMVRLYCKMRIELRNELLKTGKLRLSELDKEGGFWKIYPATKFQQLGIWRGNPRILLTCNFDGSDSLVLAQLGTEKDKIITTLEREVEYQKSLAMKYFEEARNRGIEMDEGLKNIAKMLKPIKDLVKVYPFYKPSASRFSPAMIDQPSMEEEGEF